MAALDVRLSVMRAMAMRAVLAFAALGCNGGPTEAPGPNDVLFETRDLAIHVTNGSHTTIHYIVIEREALAGITWRQCTPAEEWCPTVAPGHTAVIPYTDIVEYDLGDDEAVLYYWTTTVENGEPRPGEPVGVVIELRLFLVGRPR